MSPTDIIEKYGFCYDMNKITMGRNSPSLLKFLFNNYYFNFNEIVAITSWLDIQNAD